MPEATQTLCRDRFIPAINQLIEQTPKPEAQQALQKIIDYYQAIIEDSSTVYQARDNWLPESGGKGDQLDRTRLVEGLADILSAEDNHGHLTIGLLGHWGSGKTRVLDLLKDNLKTKGRFLFGEFNAWAYEHVGNLQAGMAHEVIRSLTTFQNGAQPKTEQSRWRRYRNTLGNALEHCGWLLWYRNRLAFGFACRKYPARFLVLLCMVILAAGLMAMGAEPLIEAWDNGDIWKHLIALENRSSALSGLGGLGLLIPIVLTIRRLFSQTLTKEWLTYVKLPSYAAHIGEVSQMREDIRLMCAIRLRSGVEDDPYHLGFLGPRKRLLFVVDDLDRCSPQGIVKTFEAIRLVLDIPQVTVVVAIDQRIALAALALHYKPMVEHHQLKNAKAIARDYLGKMIQLPIVLNEPDIEEMKGYMSYLWQENIEPGQQPEWDKLIEKGSDKGDEG